MSESGRMGLIDAAIAIAAGIVLFIAGFFELPNCGSGLSLILFGAGILSFGIGATLLGGIPALWGSIPLFLILLVAGLVIASRSGGCGYGI